MKKTFSLLLFVGVFVGLLFVSQASAATDSLYSRAFGKVKSPAVIFLHGGPGYNSATFELSSAQRLADSGYYVIVFDQRGAGRSAKLKGAYTADEAVADLLSIYDHYGIKKASLIGHSWGGTLGVLFAEKYPERVNKLVMLSSPISYQRGFKAMFTRIRNYYIQHDTTQLPYMEMIGKMDTSSLMYASSLFMHASKAGLYKASVIATEASTLMDNLKKDTAAKYFSNMTQAPVLGFYKSLHYTTLDLSERIRAINKKLPVIAIYGADDGLMDPESVNEMTKIIDKKNIYLVNGASHNVFLDQPTRFSIAITQALKAKK